MTPSVLLAASARHDHARNRRGRTRGPSALALGVVLALLFVGAGPVQAAPNPDAALTVALPWAVILSPGPTSGVRWGGYHMTVTGYSAQHACKRQAPDCETVLREHYRTLFRGQPWHLHGRLPPLERWNGLWTQTLDSDLLDTLAAELTSDGFKNVKGPHGSPTPQKWHITFGEDKQDTTAQAAVLRGKDWYLWLVPQPGDDCRLHGHHCPTWTLISLAPTPTPTPTPTPVRAPCLGACNDEGRVTIDDLITMVNIANGTTPISACPAADAEHTGTVTVDQILAAVSNALNGCPPTAG